MKTEITSLLISKVKGDLRRAARVAGLAYNGIDIRIESSECGLMTGKMVAIDPAAAASAENVVCLSHDGHQVSISKL
jgi:hypothetical protein